MMRLPWMMTIYSLAEALHMDVDDVLAMPSKRLTYWIAYFNVKAAEEKKHAAEMQAKSNVRRRR